MIWGKEVLFVHGAWEGPWAFSPWSAVFAEAGWPARSITLPGHGPGEEGAGLSLSDYVEALAEAVWEPEKTILIGHSLGAWVILKYLEEHDVAASVLVAPTPYDGVPFRMQRLLASKAAWTLFRILFLGQSVSVAKPALVKELCFKKQTADAVVKRYVERLVPESPTVVRQIALMKLRLPGEGKIRVRKLRKRQRGRPHLIVASEADRFVTPGELEDTARILGAEMLKLADAPHAVVETDEDRSVVRQVIGWLEDKLQDKLPDAG